MSPYTQLAKQAVEQYIAKKTIMRTPKDLPKELFTQRAGVFVTIYNGENLRGCIGTYLPTQPNLAREIIENAVSACSRDYRFAFITPVELPKLRYEVSVLSEPQQVEDTRTLNHHRDGIIARCDDGRCGLLLPGLDGIANVQQQIYIACQKGGIDPKLDDPKLFHFTVEKHN